jgi:hypothetical protein
MISAGVHHIVPTALRGLPHCADVQGTGLKLLRNITEVDDESAAVFRGGAVEIAVSAMKRFPDDEAVQV